MDLSIKVDGVDELIHNIEVLRNAVNGGSLALLMMQAAGVLVENAKSNAPVDTGALRQSIRSYTTLSTSSDAEMSVGTDVPYGVHQEFGTSVMPAHPFLRPAIEQTKDQYAAAVADGVWKLITGAI